MTTRDAGVPADTGPPVVDAAPPPPVACSVSVGWCVPVHDAPIQLFDAQSQSPEIVWGPDRLLLAFWGPGDGGSGGPVLQHIDLDGLILEEHRLTRGYNETHLTWNPRIGEGLLSAEGGLTWIGPDGRPTESSWISPDASFRGTFDVGPTETGFAVLMARTGLETMLGTSERPSVIEWTPSGLSDNSPAVGDRWGDDGLWALSGGALQHYDGAAWSEAITLVGGNSFQARDVVATREGIFTLHNHHDGSQIVRRWSPDGTPRGEVLIGTPAGRGSARLFSVENTLVVVSTHLEPGEPILVTEIDARTLEVARRPFFQVAEPLTPGFNRHSISVTQTPRGLAFVWTEGPVGSDMLRPQLRLFECCTME